MPNKQEKSSKTCKQSNKLLNKRWPLARPPASTHDMVRGQSNFVKGRLPDAGGPRFEFQAGRVTGKSIPSLWRDKHPAIKGLRSPEHHAGQFNPDRKKDSESNKQNGMATGQRCARGARAVGRGPRSASAPSCGAPEISQSQKSKQTTIMNCTSAVPCRASPFLILRPISALGFWTSEGLTQAES